MLGSANAPQGQHQVTAAVVTGQALGRSCSHSHSLEFRRLRRLWTGLACLVPPGPGGSASVLQCRGHRGASAHSRAWGTCSGGAVAQPDSVSQEGDTSQLSLQSPWPQLVIMGCECPPREPASCPGLQIRLRKGLASLGTPAASPGSVGLFLGLLWGGFWLGCVQYQGLTRRWTLKLEEEEGEERPSLPQEPCSCSRGYQRKKTPGQVARTQHWGAQTRGTGSSRTEQLYVLGDRRGIDMACLKCKLGWAMRCSDLCSNIILGVSGQEQHLNLWAE